MGTINQSCDQDGKGKFGHLNGKITKPADDDPMLKTWRFKNSLVIAWLINSMDLAIGKTYLFLWTTRDVWEAVWETYPDLEKILPIFLNWKQSYGSQNKASERWQKYLSVKYLLKLEGKKVEGNDGREQSILTWSFCSSIEGKFIYLFWTAMTK